MRDERNLYSCSLISQQPENGDYTIRKIVKGGELTCERIGFTVDVAELFSHLEKTL